MSVRNSIFRTADRAMPPKIATIGFQIPRPWNFIFVTPAGASKSSDSIATFGRSPLPRTTSFPPATSNRIRVTAPFCATASRTVRGFPCTSSVYFGIAGTLPAVRSASTLSLPSLTSAPNRSSAASAPVPGDALAAGRAVSPAAGDALAAGSAVSAGSVCPAAASGKSPSTSAGSTRRMARRYHSRVEVG